MLFPMFRRITITMVALLVNWCEKIFSLHLVILFLLSLTRRLKTICLDAAEESQTSIPLTKQATKIYDEICSNGLNRKDFSVVFQYLNDLCK